MRDIARNEPNKILPVIEKLRTDESLYVRKSVANMLRNAGKRNPGFVLDLCRRWSKYENPNTNWIIKDGLRKLRESREREVGELLAQF